MCFMAGKIKRINRELAYRGKILEVYSDQMLIGETISQWDFIHLRGGAAVVPVLNDGKILMIKQYRNAIDEYSLEIPAGMYDSDEEAGETCAKRELLEETGYLAKEIRWLVSVHSLVAFTDEKVDVYLAETLTKGECNLDDEEEIETVAFTVEELKEKLRAGEITDAKTVAGLYAYISQKADI